MRTQHTHPYFTCEPNIRTGTLHAYPTYVPVLSMRTQHTYPYFLCVPNIRTRTFYAYPTYVPVLNIRTRTFFAYPPRVPVLLPHRTLHVLDSQRSMFSLLLKSDNLRPKHGYINQQLHDHWHFMYGPSVGLFLTSVAKSKNFNSPIKDPMSPSSPHLRINYLGCLRAPEQRPTRSGLQ